MLNIQSNLWFLQNGYDRELLMSRGQSRGGSRSRAGSVMPPRAVTPMVNAQDIEGRIRSAVNKNWKRIQEQCRQWDMDNSGEIEVSQFKG